MLEELQRRKPALDCLNLAIEFTGRNWQDMQFDLDMLQAAFLEAITCSELRRRLRHGNAVVLDVLPAQEYAAGHIAGARSIPVAELRTRIKEVPKKRLIVAYCRDRQAGSAGSRAGGTRRTREHPKLLP
jgi:hypothetical protein